MGLWFTSALRPLLDRHFLSGLEEEGLTVQFIVLEAVVLRARLPCKGEALLLLPPEVVGAAGLILGVYALAALVKEVYLFLVADRCARVPAAQLIPPQALEDLLTGAKQEAQELGRATLTMPYNAALVEVLVIMAMVRLSQFHLDTPSVEQVHAARVRVRLYAQEVGAEVVTLVVVEEVTISMGYFMASRVAEEVLS